MGGIRLQPDDAEDLAVLKRRARESYGGNLVMASAASRGDVVYSSDVDDLEWRWRICCHRICQERIDR